MDQHEPRIIARGEWEQNEFGDLAYIPRHKAPPMGDARGNVGPWQEGRDPDDLPIDEYVPGEPTDPAVRAAMASLRDEVPDGPSGERGGYCSASKAVWEAARKEYLAGDTAETVCARYGMGVSTFRARASDENWRRKDQADPDLVGGPVGGPVDLDFETADGLPDFGRMAAHALVRLNRAVESGRAMEAARWMRLHLSLTALAQSQAKSAEAPPPAPKPAPEPRQPDMAERATAVALEIGVIAREASALTPGDFAGRDALMARVEALDDLKPPPISDEVHYSDGVFAKGEAETQPP